MPAVKSQPPAEALDPEVPPQKEPFDPQRSTFPLDMERIQSGGLKDDPTESGEPVKNKYPFRNLHGGRSKGGTPE
jgi:hypothetical protein